MTNKAYLKYQLCMYDTVPRPKIGSRSAPPTSMKNNVKKQPADNKLFQRIARLKQTILRSDHSNIWKSEFTQLS